MLQIRRKVKDLLIPMAECAVVNVNDPLKEAALRLRTIYCEVETGACTEAGHRTALVVNDAGDVVGILDFKGILGILIPELAGGLTARLQSLSTSIAFAEAGASELDETELQFKARVVKNAQIPIKDVMLKLRGSIDADAELIDALKAIYRNKLVVLPVVENGKTVGIVRDSDLFLAMADILNE
jgi:CBS domain-containing protein